MAKTHRSELVEKLEIALNDEAYDGGSGPLSDAQFSTYVRRLATTAAEVVVEPSGHCRALIEAAESMTPDEIHQHPMAARDKLRALARELRTVGGEARA